MLMEFENDYNNNYCQMTWNNVFEARKKNVGIKI